MELDNTSQAGLGAATDNVAFVFLSSSFMFAIVASAG